MLSFFIHIFSEINLSKVFVCTHNQLYISEKNIYSIVHQAHFATPHTHTHTHTQTHTHTHTHTHAHTHTHKHCKFSIKQSILTV